MLGVLALGGLLDVLALGGLLDVLALGGLLDVLVLGVLGLDGLIGADLLDLLDRVDVVVDTRVGSGDAGGDGALARLPVDDGLAKSVVLDHGAGGA